MLGPLGRDLESPGHHRENAVKAFLNFDGRRQGIENTRARRNATDGDWTKLPGVTVPLRSTAVPRFQSLNSIRWGQGAALKRRHHNATLWRAAIAIA